jgi:peptide-methionine (R)-S-oxide reductase
MDEQEFKVKLTPEQYRVMREKGTEHPHTGTYWNHEETGIYTCAACGSILFLSLNKLKAESGWPTFTKSANSRTLVLAQDGERIEVSCKKCTSHLGYVTDENGKKYLEINSVALGFLELPDIEWEESGDQGDDKNESKDSQQTQQNTSAAKTISLTIGGLTIGAALGAGFMWQSTPPQGVCVPSAAQLQQMSSPAPAANNASGGAPRPTGGTRPAPVSPVVVAPASNLATSSSATPAGGATGTSSPAAGSSGSTATTTP